MSELVSLIKKASREARNADKPSDVMYGTVTQEKPLKIKLDQGLELENDQITVPEHLTDYKVEIEILEAPFTDAGGAETNGSGGGANSHTHGLSQVRKIKVKNHLKKDQRVAIQRMDGGQEFVIIDRLEQGTGGGGGCGT